MFWGYAPALDLLREFEKSSERDAKRKQDETATRSAVGNDGEPPSTDNGRTGTPVVSNDGKDDGRVRRDGRHPAREKSQLHTRPGSDDQPAGDTGYCAEEPAGANNGRPPNAAGDYPKRQSRAEDLDIFNGITDGTNARCELHSMIRFLNAKGRTLTEIHRQLTAVYGEACMDIRNVRKWFREFKEGHTVVHDEQRVGKLSVSDATMAKVEAFLLEGYFPMRSSNKLLGEDTFNILLVGSCDARHIFKTISRLHHHPGHKPVRICVLDPVAEMVARQLILLYAALQAPKRLGHKEKVRLLMEITGNTLIRPVTAAWITKSAKRLQEMVTNESLLRGKMPQVWVNQLRYQEKDQLEDIYSFWQARPQNFRIGYYWDDRLRKTLKTRYDLRSNIFDWDYFMVLKDLPRGDRICMREYKNWRSSGVAFTWLEAEPSEPNVTLATGIFREGGNLLHHGYLGDLKTSPYIAYSTEVEPEDEKDMWVKRNDGYAQRSTDVAERHLSRITYEMMEQQPYEPPADTESSLHGVIITQVTDLSHVNPEVPPVDEDDDPTRRRRRYDPGEQSSDVDDSIFIPRDVQVIFLSSKLLRDPGALRRAFSEQFNVVVVASVLAEAHVHADLLGAMRNEGLLLVEGNRFHLLRRAELEENAAKLVERIQLIGFQLEREFNPREHDYSRFRVRR